MQPRVTIVTPSFNQGNFIRATIESVLAQDEPNLEYIVMDGGSTDHTGAVVSEYRSRLTWISEADRGQAHAINKGFRQARGDIVAWLNSDDVYLPGAVRRAVSAFERATDAGAIYGEGYLMDGAGGARRRFPATEPFNLWKLTYLSDYVLQQSTFFRRNAVEQVGWLDETLHYTLDWDLLIRLGRRFGLQYVPEYFGVLREHPGAKTFAGGRRRSEEIRRLLEHHTSLRRAPGYWTYHLETIQREWRDRLVTNAPAWLQRPAKLLNLLVYLPTAVAIMLILRHSQGLYPDWWASDRMKWMVPEGAGVVVIRGELPDDPRMKGAVLSVHVANAELCQWQLSPGLFELRFFPPQHCGPFSFELRCSKYRRAPLNGKSRFGRVTFRLHSIDWANRRSTAADHE